MEHVILGAIPLKESLSQPMLDDYSMANRRVHLQPIRFIERLKFAAANGNTSVIHEMMQMDANSNRQASAVSTALCYAVNAGHLGTVSALLSYGADVNVGYTTPGTFTSIMKYPLGIAAKIQDIHLLKLLLAKGANPNTQDQHYTQFFDSCPTFPGQTALHYAVDHANVEIVGILLQFGARTDLANRNGDTPFHLAVSCFDHRSGSFSEANGCQRCKKPILEMLCQSSLHLSQLNMVNRAGFSVLHLAVRHGVMRSNLQLLLDGGATPNQRMESWNNTPPLWAAVERYLPWLVITLLRNGSNLNVVDDEDNTLLMRYIYIYRESYIPQILIVHGASLQNLDKKTVVRLYLEYGVKNSHMLCPLLVYAGCKLNKEIWQRPFTRQQSRHEGLCVWLSRMQKNPHNLTDLARIAIRSHLNEKVLDGSSVVASICQLHVPKLIKDYLLLKELR